ncbi:GAF domain-containing protein [Haloechinothrix salitolerans]
MNGLRQRPAAALAEDRLGELDEKYVELMSMLEPEAVMRRVVREVPESLDIDVAWVGKPDSDDTLLIGDSVRARTDVLDGLAVPKGVGLGGQVMLTKRPMWVKNYITSPRITHDFASQAQLEGLRAMIAVPIMHDDRVLGVLYGANRYETDFGDRAAHVLGEIAGRAATATVVAERAKESAEVAVYEERRRVALELHDTVGAMLYAVSAGIRTLGAEVTSLVSAPHIKDKLQAIEEQASEAAAMLRGSLRVLSNAPEKVALGVAVREDTRAFQERTGTTTRMITVTELPPLLPSRVRVLSAATREALLNVEKHAHADSVVVTLVAVEGGVAVTVVDDGVGLAPRSSWDPGLGLAAISDRLARLGGNLTVSSGDDGGVSVRAWVPR